MGVDADTTTVSGLQPSVSISGADADLDHLKINTLAGSDNVNEKDDTSSVIQISIAVG